MPEEALRPWEKAPKSHRHEEKSGRCLGSEQLHFGSEQLHQHQQQWLRLQQ
jgi:hypothetical protein